MFGGLWLSLPMLATNLEGNQVGVGNDEPMCLVPSSCLQFSFYHAAGWDRGSAPSFDHGHMPPLPLIVKPGGLVPTKNALVLSQVQARGTKDMDIPRRAGQLDGYGQDSLQYDFDNLGFVKGTGKIRTKKGSP